VGFHCFSLWCGHFPSSGVGRVALEAFCRLLSLPTSLFFLLRLGDFGVRSWRVFFVGSIFLPLKRGLLVFLECADEDFFFLPFFSPYRDIFLVSPLFISAGT